MDIDIFFSGFECECCGECCSGSMKVFLNPEDLLRMARAEGLGNTIELIEGGLVVIDRERGGVPLPRIRFRESAVKCCPFVENRMDDDGRLSGLCSLHPDRKPLVCWLAPLYREVDLSAAGGESEGWGFKLPHPGCPGGGAESTGLCGCRDGFFDAETRRRLDAETVFFRELSQFLDTGAEEGDIIDRFYRLDTGIRRG